MAKSQILYEELYKPIKDKMRQSNNISALRNIFNEMIGKNNEALSSPIPDKAVYMDARTENKYFDIIGVSRNTVINAIKKAPDISNEFLTIKNPMYVSLTMLVIVFKHLKKEDMVNQSMFICSLYMYRNIRSKYFSKVSQNTINIMNYTLSRISYKSDLKKYGSVLKMIGKKNEVFLNNWFDTRSKETMGVITDETILNMVNDNYRRYSTTMNTFYREFKIDSLNGNYMNVQNEDEDDENFMEPENVSFSVEKLTIALMGKFSLSSYPNSVLIKQTCAIESGCSMNNLRNILNYAYDQHKQFEELIRLILQTYLFDLKKRTEDIKGFDFIIEMRTYYRKQTSQDENLNQIKKIINGFIVGSGISKKINRAATLNDCKKATFLYMLLFIKSNI